MHAAHNKNKLLFVLHSSKTHGKYSHPQKIKISGNVANCHFCPFKLTKQYIEMREDFANNSEQFFVFRDKTPITCPMVQRILKRILNKVNMETAAFDCQSFRSGHACDLLKAIMSIKYIKIMGRWKSNAVFRYLRI